MLPLHQRFSFEKKKIFPLFSERLKRKPQTPVYRQPEINIPSVTSSLLPAFSSRRSEDHLLSPPGTRHTFPSLPFLSSWGAVKSLPSLSPGECLKNGDAHDGPSLSLDYLPTLVKNNNKFKTMLHLHRRYRPAATPGRREVSCAPRGCPRGISAAVSHHLSLSAENLPSARTAPPGCGNLRQPHREAEHALRAPGPAPGPARPLRGGRAPAPGRPGSRSPAQVQGGRGRVPAARVPAHPQRD